MTNDCDDDHLCAFAEVGRDLLSFELERSADDLEYEFSRALKKARNDDHIIESDAAAREALLAYALATENESLAEDLLEWVSRYENTERDTTDKEY